MPKTIITNSAKETFELAENFAKKLKSSQVIGLIGDLGAGKTVFSQGFARGLGVKNNITSPTFVLMKVYDIENKKRRIKIFCHVDAYRLDEERDLKAIGIEEYFDQKNTIILIEWADRVRGILPKGTIFIKIKIEKNNKRIIKIKF